MNPIAADPAKVNSKPETFEQWALVELMGHQRIAGMVTETTLAGKGMLRVDVPKPDGSDGFLFTRIYSPDAVYCINPVDRQIAIGLAAGLADQCRPVHLYDLQRLIADKKVDTYAGYAGPETFATNDDQ